MRWEDGRREKDVRLDGRREKRGCEMRRGGDHFRRKVFFIIFLRNEGNSRTPHSATPQKVSHVKR